MGGDFQFIVMEKYLSQDNELPFFERVIMKLYFCKELSLSGRKGIRPDPSNVTIEKFLLIVSPVPNFNLKRWMPSMIYRDRYISPSAMAPCC